MIRGLYISQKNMVFNDNRLEILSNNLSNSETIAYKKSDVVSKGFNEVLISKFNGSSSTNEPEFTKIEVSKIGDDYTATTNSGYFKIQSEGSISNDRGVKFSVDDEGYLSTYFLNANRTKDWNYGDKLVGKNGFIYVGEGEVEIKEDGSVFSDGTLIDNLVHQVDKDVIGTLSVGYNTKRDIVDFNQGSIKITGRKADFALNGEGFFLLDTPFGELYTRNGVFEMDGEGNLKTYDGYNVLGLNGPIKLDKNSDFSVNEFGEIAQNDELVDKFKLAKFSNDGDLKKVSGTIFVPKDNMQGEILDFTGTVLQGHVETSNINIINEMTKMISLNRNYESGQKVITAIDSAIGKAVNEVGRIG